MPALQEMEADRTAHIAPSSVLSSSNCPLVINTLSVRIACIRHVSVVLIKDHVLSCKKMHIALASPSYTASASVLRCIPLARDAIILTHYPIP